MKIINYLTTSILLLSLSLAKPHTVNASIAFTKYSSNPILKIGDPKAWDKLKVYGSSILLDANIFRMWFGGSDGLKREIGYATSTNSADWLKPPNNPIIRWDFVDGSDYGVEHPFVLRSTGSSGSIYKMWFNNMNRSQYFKLKYSTSDNGLIWSTPIDLIFDTKDSWESQGRTAPTIFQESDKKYHMWFTTKGIYNGALNWRIGYATSEDGLHWTKHPTPVLEVTEPWENVGVEDGIGNPSVLFEDGTYHFWYHANRDIGHATSNDGITWIKDPNNPVLQSSDDPNSFDSVRIMDPFVLKKDGIYYMYYTGVNSDGKWQIGLATSEQLPTPPFFPTPTLSPTISPTLTVTPTPIILPSITPSVTPTPPATSFSPIIIVPGLGTSWNPRAIFSCNLSPSGFWKLAPYVSSYNRLIKTLTKNAKLKLGRDVYVYAYDWRLPLDQQGEELRNYINGLLTNKPLGTKVRLIGHSLGGLVIRSYLENNPNSHQAKAVMTVGTPHQGTVLAYPIWEKGEIWTDDWLIKIALTQLVNHCRYTIRPATPEEPRISRFKIKSGKEIVQLLAPAIKQLLPIFDFLRQNGSIKKTSSLIHQNDWLFSHPLPINFYNVDFNTLSGGNIPTLRYLEVVAPSAEEQTAGDWLDGRPVNQETISQGDGTTLQMSSQAEGAKNEIITGDHGEIIAGNQGIQKILQFLDLEKIKPAEAIPIPEETTQRVLMISLDQEAKLELTDPKGKTLISEENLVVSYNPEIGNFKLRITPRVSAQTYLHLIQLEKSPTVKSNTYRLHLRKNQAIDYLISYTPFGSSLQLIPRISYHHPWGDCLFTPQVFCILSLPLI